MIINNARKVIINYQREIHIFSHDDVKNFFKINMSFFLNSII